MSELGPQQVLERASDAALHVHSVRRIETEVNELAGQRTESRKETILLGENWHLRTQDEGFYMEQLSYGGRLFFRMSPDASWRREMREGDVIPAGEVGWVVSGGRTRPEIVSSKSTGIYGIDLDWLSSAERLPDEIIEGKRMIHLAASFSRPVSKPEDLRSVVTRMHEEIFAAAGLSAPEFPLGTIPSAQGDSVDLRFDIWIGSVDFYVYKTETVITLRSGDRTISSGRKTQHLSDFNEPLELPGPLPDI